VPGQVRCYTNSRDTTEQPDAAVSVFRLRARRASDAGNE